MAMTKAEKLRMDNLERALRMARALRWPDYPMPQSMSRDDIEATKVRATKDRWGHDVIVAFGYFPNPYSVRVTHGCSNGTSHNREGNITTTQGMGMMYKTQLEAWQFIRHRLTEEFSEKLAKVDEAIAACTP